MKVALKSITDLVNQGMAQDISSYTGEELTALEQREGYLTQIMYSEGVRACIGVVLIGHATHQLYVVVGRHAALFRPQ